MEHFCLVKMGSRCKVFHTKFLEQTFEGTSFHYLEVILVGQFAFVVNEYQEDLATFNGIEHDLMVALV